MAGQNFNMSNKIFLSFFLDSWKYAIDASCVQEIKNLQDFDIISMPAPPFIKGCIQFRGKITPIIDLELIYHQKGKSYLSRDTIIFVQVNQEYAGIITKGLPNLIELSEKDISSENMDESMKNKCIQAIGTSYNEPYYILDLNKLLLEQDIYLYHHEQTE